MDANEYEPTESEVETIERAGLAAAWQELRPLLDDDLEGPQRVMACLKAFKAARAAAYEATLALKAGHPEASYISHYPEITLMVCSALMALDDGPDEIHPRSMLGARIAVLIKAAKALEAMAMVHSSFDDEDEVFGVYLADETTRVAEAWSTERGSAL